MNETSEKVGLEDGSYLLAPSFKFPSNVSQSFTEPVVMLNAIVGRNDSPHLWKTESTEQEGTRYTLHAAGEMAQSFRALAPLPEDLNSVPSTYMVAHNCL